RGHIAALALGRRGPPTVGRGQIAPLTLSRVETFIRAAAGRAGSDMAAPSLRPSRRASPHVLFTARPPHPSPRVPFTARPPHPSPRAFFTARPPHPSPRVPFTARPPHPSPRAFFTARPP